MGEWKKVRKKPVIVRARLNEGDAYEIKTLEGTMKCEHGDWEIEGVKGERYPCKPGIFLETYGFVDEEGG